MEPILYETVDYEQQARRKKRKRYWLVALASLVSIVLLAYAILLLPVLFKSNDSPINSWQDKNIPLYTNEIFQSRTNYTYTDPKTNQPSFYFEKRFYLSDDREQQVKAFFNQKLPAAGWVLSQGNPPDGLNPNNAIPAVKITFKRGTKETLLLELNIQNNQRTAIGLTYQQTLT